MMHARTIVIVASMLTGFGSKMAIGQPEGGPPCGSCGSVTFIDSNRSYSISWDLGDWDILSWSGAAEARCSGTTQYPSRLSCDCRCTIDGIDPRDYCCDLDEQLVTVFDVDDDSSDGLSADCNENVGDVFIAGSFCNIDVPAATSVMYGAGSGVNHGLWEFFPYGGGSITGQTFELANGFGNVARNVELEKNGPDDMSYTRTYDYDLSVDFTACQGNEFGPDCPPRDPKACKDTTNVGRIFRVDFTSDTSAVTTTTDQTIDVQQGVVAANSDGTITRLGIYADPAFAPQTMGGVTTINGSMSIALDLSDPDIISVSFDFFEDSYDAQNGDIDGDGGSSFNICGTDREDLASRIGATIGSVDYHVRADLDLDGDIDADDCEIFNQFPCTVDWNCDGAHNVIDNVEFQTRFSAGAPSADINCDGAVDVFDFVEYQAAFGVGCP